MQWRFIPTGVGNIPFPKTIDLFKPVHPHRRGEHIVFGLGKVILLGSSPQAWGTCLTITHMAHDLRFIPTGVGNMNGM